MTLKGAKFVAGFTDLRTKSRYIQNLIDCVRTHFYLTSQGSRNTQIDAYIWHGIYV